VLEARRRNPDWGPRRLVHEASKAGLQSAPSRSGIYRALEQSSTQTISVGFFMTD
jgi:hypothetical protein